MRKIAVLLVVAVATALALTAFAQAPTIPAETISTIAPSETTSTKPTTPSQPATSIPQHPERIPDTNEHASPDNVEQVIDVENLTLDRLIFFDIERSNVESLCVSQPNCILTSITGTITYVHERQISINIPEFTTFTIEFVEPHQYSLGDTVEIWLAITK